MGGGLQTELSAIRLKMAQPAKTKPVVTTPPVPAPLPVPQRRVVAFKPKLPAVSKKVAKPPAPAGMKTRVVFKVKVKSPALQRRLGVA